jgi:hypothetical protein
MNKNEGRKEAASSPKFEPRVFLLDVRRVSVPGSRASL